ncbi:hypothetical protein CN984_00305 [Bacillus cereus]|uniref:Uncharacterized protein n=1 Tax=Bacillus cereus TaxID=1396 RepID=A0A2B9QFT6_BACCE|nr:hypothetical protein [Bacillus cereus]PGO33757.1 hypothetical protein CN984_00305 [Bacillus cereus]
MRIGTNVLSIEAHERHMHVALTMVSNKSNFTNSFEVIAVLNITFKTVEITPLKIKGGIHSTYVSHLLYQPIGYK